MGDSHYNGKILELLLPDALQKGCHTNPGQSMGGLPKVQLACALPRMDLSCGGWFDEAVVVERDDIHFGATIGAPSQSCLGSANDDQGLGLYTDSGCFHCHGSLPLVDHWCMPPPVAASCSDARSKVLKERLKISQRLSVAVF
jgi:hypothetical protein